MELRPGSHLDTFEILSRLGEGAMGVVYRARDPALDREVAIKVLPEDVSSHPSRVERFKREARAASALNHPNIVTIHEIGTSAAGLYLVMELVRGRTLRDMIEAEPLDAAELTRLGLQAADGLAAAHDAGIVHRDLKPDNLMVTGQGLLKILDFGLAKLTTQDESGSQDTEQTATHDELATRQGAMMGTIAYMSPEQAAGRPLDGRSDQFSLGTILYEMATGRRPFGGESMGQTLALILGGEPEPLTKLRPELPEAFVTVVNRLLAKSPEGRFESTAELAAMMRGGSTVTAAALPRFLGESSDQDGQLPRRMCVGRELELQSLAERLQRSLDRSGQLALVTGEAGSGKTTLLSEFMRRAQDSHPDLAVAVGNCDAQTGIGDPYLPFREILGLLTGDVEARWAARAISRDHAMRLWNLVPHAVKSVVNGAPDLLGTFLPAESMIQRASACAVEPERLSRLRELARNRAPGGLQQSAILDQCTRFLLDLSEERPLLLVLEDVHWADAGTVGQLFHLCRRLAGHPIFVLGSFRPAEVSRGSGEGGHSLDSTLRELKSGFGDFEIRVGETAGREFVDAVVDSQPNRLDRGFRDALYRQTQGHPLFTVELLRELRDGGFVTADSDGRYVADETLDWNTLPSRVEAVIAERVERLPENLKRLLRLASVEGEEFTAEVVARVEGIGEREVVRLLSEQLDKRHRLVSAHDLRRVGQQRLSQYRFRHILFQKYLYQSMDRVERSYLHESVGTGLESMVAERADEWAAQLARHFEAAELPDRAIDYLKRAGQRAMSLAANMEAADYLSRALELLGRLPESAERNRRELSLQVAHGTALGTARGLGSRECERAYTRATELIRDTDPVPQLMPIQFGLFAYHSSHGNWTQMEAVTETMQRLAAAEADPGLELQANHSGWTGRLFTGDLNQARCLSEEGIRIYRTDAHHPMTFAYGNHDPGVCCRSQGAWISALLGKPQRAVELMQDAEELAGRLGHRVTQLVVESSKATLRQYLGEVEEALEEASTTLAGCSKSDPPLWIALCRVTHGWSLSASGRLDEGIEELTRAYSSLSTVGQDTWKPYTGGLLVEAYLSAGRVEEAAEALRAAFSVMDLMEGRRHFHFAELHRWRGELLLREPSNEAEAAAAFTSALQVAAAQGARLLELRAATSLASLRRGAEDRARLERLCALFTDGYEFASLREARELLAQL